MPAVFVQLLSQMSTSFSDFWDSGGGQTINCEHLIKCDSVGNVHR